MLRQERVERCLQWEYFDPRRAYLQKKDIGEWMNVFLSIPIKAGWPFIFFILWKDSSPAIDDGSVFRSLFGDDGKFETIAGSFPSYTS